jgi:hypothetical protein
MLSAAKHLAAYRDRPFAECTLSEANVLRVTLRDSSNCQALFFTLEPCLRFSIDGDRQGPKRVVIKEETRSVLCYQESVDTMVSRIHL